MTGTVSKILRYFRTPPVLFTEWLSTPASTPRQTTPYDMVPYIQLPDDRSNGIRIVGAEQWHGRGRRLHCLLDRGAAGIRARSQRYPWRVCSSGILFNHARGHLVVSDQPDCAEIPNDVGPGHSVWDPAAATEQLSNRRVRLAAGNHHSGGRYVAIRRLRRQSLLFRRVDAAHSLRRAARAAPPRPSPFCCPPTLTTLTTPGVATISTRAARKEFSGHSGFQRPSNQNHLSPTGIINHTLYSDLLLLRWMTAQGIAYDCYDDGDLELRPAWLSHYSALVLGSHPEYWSGQCARIWSPISRRAVGWSPASAVTRFLRMSFSLPTATR